VIILERSTLFDRSMRKFVKGNKKRALLVKKTLRLLLTNPRHPSLRLEKLQNSKIWTIRIDRGNRIFLVRINASALLLVDIGSHDKYKSINKKV